MCKGIMSENITRKCTGRYYYSQKGQKDQKSTLKVSKCSKLVMLHVSNLIILM